MAEPLLATIQQAIKTRLDAMPYFSTLTVVTEGKGDFVSMVNASLLKAGVGVLVLTPGAFASKPNVPGPYFYNESGGIKILVQVYENPAINRGSEGTQKPASTIAENVVASLHLHTPEGLGVITIDPSRPTIESDLIGRILIYDVNLMTHGGLTLE